MTSFNFIELGSLPATNPAPVEHKGCRLVFNVRGDGPPVVLIQGVGVHGDGWLPQVKDLMRRYTCLTFDNRGMGASQPIGVSLTIEQMAEDTLVLLDALGWDSAHVVGHSLGGLIALHLALNARERVRSLGLLCTFAKGSVATSLTPKMLWLGLRTSIGPRRMRRRAFMEMILPPNALAKIDRDAAAESLAPLFGHDLADQPPVAMKQLGAMRNYDVTPRLEELAGLPTLVVSAVHDPIAPPSAGRVLAGGIPQAHYVELPDASHGVPLQQADLINRLLLEHLDQAEASAGR